MTNNLANTVANTMTNNLANTVANTMTNNLANTVANTMTNNTANTSYNNTIDVFEAKVWVRSKLNRTRHRQTSTEQLQ